jgi:MFS family permease
VLAKPPYLRHALLATLLTSTLLFAYWGFFSWVPTYLARPPEEGGAGLGVVKSAAWVIPMQLGAFLGYTSFGFLADRYGRRLTFVVFVLGAAVTVPIFATQARDVRVLMIVGPLVGFFGHGYFSVFGAMLAELFPSSIRAAAQGMCYNLGRAFSALAPVTIGAIANTKGLGYALGLTSLLYVVAAVIVFTLPETRGKEIA